MVMTEDAKMEMQEKESAQDAEKAPQTQHLDIDPVIAARVVRKFDVRVVLWVSLLCK